MLDLGDVFQIAVDIKDADGTLVNPSTADLTITLPDGTTATPAVTLPPAETGKIREDYLSSQAGRHAWSLVTTGPNTAYRDVFDVRPADSGFIVSLADAKAHLNKTDDEGDEKLRSFIAAATHIVERHPKYGVGSVVRRTVTERRDGGRPSIVLLQPPVISITSVTESGIALTASNWSLSDAGVLTRLAGSYPWCWRYGVQNIEIVYVAGRPVIPDNVIDATKEIVSHLWDTQRGKTGAFQQVRGLDDDAAIGADASALVLQGMALPRRAMELLSVDSETGFA